MPRPIPELASENACGSEKGEGGTIRRETAPEESARAHQVKSAAMTLSGRCGKNGFFEQVLNMRSKPMRYV